MIAHAERFGYGRKDSRHSKTTATVSTTGEKTKLCLMVLMAFLDFMEKGEDYTFSHHIFTLIDDPGITNVPFSSRNTPCRSSFNTAFCSSLSAWTWGTSADTASSKEAKGLIMLQPEGPDMRIDAHLIENIVGHIALGTGAIFPAMQPGPKLLPLPIS